MVYLTIYHFYKKGLVMKVIIFDIGGTLIANNNFDFTRGIKYLYDEVIDTKESYEEFMKYINSFYEVFQKRIDSDIEINFYSYLNFITFSYPKKTPLTDEEIEKCFVSKIFDSIVFDGLTEFLDYLIDQNYELYVLSNTMFSTKEIKYELERVGLLKYFKEVVASGDHLFRKPSKHLFNMYLKHLEKYNVEDIAYVGNEYKNDIVTPRDLGMKCFLKGNCNQDIDGYHEFDNYQSLLAWFKNNG